MYSTRPNLLLGFHGCEREEQTKLLGNPGYFRKSKNSYDWLGHGMYFWENNQARAMDWAKMKNKSGSIKEPAVIGAVIDLGLCLDLFDSDNLELLKGHYYLLEKETDRGLPKNIKHPSETGDDKILRYLDCAVIEYLHSFSSLSKLQPFDSVKAAFLEGMPLYPGAGFRDKTHVQICVRNPNCIKGFFLPRKEDSGFSPV